MRNWIKQIRDLGYGMMWSDMQTALTDTHLYVTDPSRNEFWMIELH